MKLASFDIFDTSLIRRCGRPEAVFDLLAHRLYPTDRAAREAFVHWRSHQARGETLADIYSDAGADFAEHTTAGLMQAEMEMEAEMLAVNPAMAEVIADYRKQGYEIMYLSDMYHSSDFLSGVLQREGLLQPGDRVVVSCERHATKATGSLYRAVRAELQPTEWHHWGDHRHSDIRMARRCGVKAHWADTRFSPVELRMLSEARRSADGWQLRMLAGFSRYARLSSGDTAAIRLGADYVAPVYTAFVAFVLADARERGISRLHFISRDGYVMHRIAEAIAPEGIECRYFFASRKALKRHNPLLRKYMEDEGFGQGHCAFVDVGWHGTSRKMLCDELRAAGWPEALTYYVGLRRDALSRRHGGFVPYFRLGELNTGGMTSLVEAYFSASPWPTTADYRLSDDGTRVEPVFADGCSRQDTEVTLANERACTTVAALLARYDIFTPSVLRQWANIALYSLDQLADPVDVKPMQLVAIDTTPLVHRLGPLKLLLMTFAGKKYWDMFAPGSYVLTLGRRLGIAANALHNVTVRIAFRVAPYLRRMGVLKTMPVDNW